MTSFMQLYWFVCGDCIPEKDSQLYLGILRGVSHSHSNLFRNAEVLAEVPKCRWLVVHMPTHPFTVFHLYKTLCLPILLYCCEL